MILKGKGFRVVGDNFLNYNSMKHYDLIIQNPPFSLDDKFLLKVIEIQKGRGGTIISLLNAETLKNPYSNTRKDLVRQLEELNAEIEYISDAFIDSERYTNVEIALVKIKLEKPEQSSIILEELRQEESHREESDYNNNSVVNGDFIKGIVEQYNFEVKAGLKLIAEYNAMKPLINSSFKKDAYNSPILELKLNNKDDTSTLENGYIKQVRAKYWQTLFTSEQFMGLFTSNLRHEYYNKVRELVDYDFSLYNIYTIKIQLNNEMVKSVERTILDLFEDFSHKHHWNETSKNVYLYNGWKSNSAFKINKRIIYPLSAYNNWSGRYEPTNYKVIEKLQDVEKALSYLDGGITELIDLKEVLKFAEGYGETKKIQLSFFSVTFYKKGTTHIEFTNTNLLDKFNIFAGKQKNWIPGNFGRATYREMSKEERDVVDSFCGKDEYNKIYSNSEYYLYEPSKTLMLA